MKTLDKILDGLDERKDKEISTWQQIKDDLTALVATLGVMILGVAITAALFGLIGLVTWGLVTLIFG